MAGPYYVDAATGSDSDTGLTEALAFATIQKGLDSVNNGETLYVKGGTDYTESARITDAAGSGSWIWIIGYTSTVDDGGQFTIDATGETYGMWTSLSSLYYVIKNMIIENASSHGYGGASDTYSQDMIFENCEFNNNGGTGCYAGNDFLAVNCKASGNTASGFQIGSNSLALCESTGNGSHGYAAKYNATFYSCTSISNADSGFTSTNSCASCYGCTIDGDSKDTTTGIYGNAARPSGVVNTIVYDCATGASNNTSNNGVMSFTNCLFNSNTNDFTNIHTNAQNVAVSSAPGFTDEAGGDYTLGSSSPAINAGGDASGTSSPGMDIGAHQSEDAGSGGSRVIITG